ncbi:MAG: hypothetical protein AAGI37_09605 [Planctomycetota bacterium]
MPPVLRDDEPGRLLQQYMAFRDRVTAGPELRSDEAREMRRLAHMLRMIPAPSWREGKPLGSKNFAGAGWRATAGARPTDLFDLCAKVHDFGYEANGISFTSISQDRSERSRKSKCDYIFRQMAKSCGVVDDLEDVFLSLGARLAFLGRNSLLFRSGDGFVNVIGDERFSSSQGHRVIPFSELSAADRERIELEPSDPNENGWPTRHDYTAELPIDRTHSTWWGRWAQAKYARCWKRVTSLSERTRFNPLTFWFW